ncbi:hypothetical protein [Novosphingobium sp. PhB165]|uniref:hypothetical protein n=1 Tax=Novosphingobium sp. PhB165 TaxID=2485105 RepID=UPI00140436A6|nr:hypothetical protein [Novosphingobium sp. PhB165]
MGELVLYALANGQDVDGGFFISASLSSGIEPDVIDLGEWRIEIKRITLPKGAPTDA